MRPSLVSSNDLKVIIGEVDWWSALKWNKSEGLQTPNLDSVFVPIKGDTDLMTQQKSMINFKLGHKKESLLDSQKLFINFPFFSNIKIISILFMLSTAGSLSYYIFKSLPKGGLSFIMEFQVEFKQAWTHFNLLVFLNILYSSLQRRYSQAFECPKTDFELALLICFLIFDILLAVCV